MSASPPRSGSIAHGAGRPRWAASIDGPLDGHRAPHVPGAPGTSGGPAPKVRAARTLNLNMSSRVEGSTWSLSVSVVIVTHNEGGELARTVEAIRETVPESTEIVVIDDVSTDGSADALEADEGVDAGRAGAGAAEVPGRWSKERTGRSASSRPDLGATLFGGRDRLQRRPRATARRVARSGSRRPCRPRRRRGDAGYRPSRRTAGHRLRVHVEGHLRCG